MKRLVWLLLAVFCTAFAQVQPADLPETKAKVCACCQIPGTCRMPGCCPKPAHAPTVLNSGSPARTTALTARRAVKSARHATVKFYLPFVESVAASATF